MWPKALKFWRFLTSTGLWRLHWFSEGFPSAWLAPTEIMGSLASGEITVVKTLDRETGEMTPYQAA